MIELYRQQCVACRVGEPTLTSNEIEGLNKQLLDWEVLDDLGILKLRREYSFDDFVGALAFTNRVGELAESINHHPDILTQWGKVTLTWWSHKIKGLHQNDFVMAAKSDELF
ncbi:MAG: 4a-hydroxytetrahydrobiopterin dehydratase [Bermanella sp.]